MSSKRIKILGVPVDMVNEKEAMEIFKGLMEMPGCSQIVTPNSEIVVNASKNPQLKELISNSGLIIPDGIGLVYASRILGCPLSERVTGVDFLEKIIAYLEETGQSIFFLGSKPASEEMDSVATMAAVKIVEKYPKLRVAGTHHGYFKEPDEENLVKIINESGADFLCVALGSPKQEEFVARHSEVLKVKATIGVGGSLDVWAGTVKRAPKFYQDHGLEWLYRFVQEPTRYKRMAALPIFMMRVLGSKLKYKEEVKHD